MGRPAYARSAVASDVAVGAPPSPPLQLLLLLLFYLQRTDLRPLGFEFQPRPGYGAAA